MSSSLVDRRGAVAAAGVVPAEMAKNVIGAEELFHAHAEQTVRFLRWMGLRGPDVDDALQEIFLTAHRRGGFTVGTAQPFTWLTRIAVNVVRSRRRGRRRHPEEPSERVDFQIDERDPEKHSETMQSLALVERALDTLDFDKRSLVVLLEIEGRSYEEVARTLEIDLRTLYVRVHRAKKEFIAAFERLESNLPRAE